MKKITRYLAAVFMLMFSAACERQLNVGFSTEKPLVVMNGILHADLPVNVTVGKSFSFMETDSFAAYLPNASVDLYINGKFTEKMRLVKVDSARNVSRSGMSHFSSMACVKTGDRVRLEASAPGMEAAWVETSVPLPPTIEKVDTATYITMLQSENSDYDNGYYNSYYYGNIPNVTKEPFFRMMRLSIGLRAPNSSGSNYFGLRISRLEPSNSPHHESVPWSLPVDTQEDPIFANNPKNSIFDALFEKNSNYRGSLVFTDNLFRNGTYTLKVNTTGYYAVDVNYEKNGNVYEYVSHEVRNPPLEITVSAFSPELYQYLKSTEETRYDDELYFISEPKVTFTNVNNGIGVVGAVSSVRKRIQPPPYPGDDKTVPR